MATARAASASLREQQPALASLLTTGCDMSIEICRQGGSGPVVKSGRLACLCAWGVFQAEFKPSPDQQRHHAWHMQQQRNQFSS